jgi:hypothetical protein
MAGAVARLYARITLFVFSVSLVVHAYASAYLGFRANRNAALGDALLHYNAIGWWWRFGDSPRGFTLTPSPSLIDFGLQLPIAWLTPDFERFAYVLALVYSLLLFLSLLAIVKIVLATRAVIAAAIAATIMLVYYTVTHFGWLLHSFGYNHTSEVFTSLGVAALAYAMFRPGSRWRNAGFVLYPLAVAGCVIQSPFFIATFCVPIAFATVALFGTPWVNLRRLIVFGGLSVIGAVLGMYLLAYINRYVWPIRGDHYLINAKQSFTMFTDSLREFPHVGISFLAMLLGAVAAIVLAIAGRRSRKLGESMVFMLVFYAVTVFSCTVLPMKRGALGGLYEHRYLQLPWLLTITFYVIVAVMLARRYLVPRVRPRIESLSERQRTAGIAALGLAAIVLVVTTRGPLTMYDPASTTSETIKCVQWAEQTGLHDGLATGFMSRYLNAAMFADNWDSPNVIVQIYSGHPPQPHTTESNALWFNGPTYRGGRKLNYLITNEVDDSALASVKEWIGPPDRKVTCPLPIDFRYDGPTFDIWIWDRPEPQQRLAELVTHDNLRGPFVPVVGAKKIDIDMKWGLSAPPSDSALVGNRRVWRKGQHRDAGVVGQVRSFILPSGLYEFDLELDSKAENDSAVAKIEVWMERKTQPLRTFAVAPGVTRAKFKFWVRNLGGPTSGDLVWMYILEQWAEFIELRSLTITQLKPTGAEPFKIFH